MSWSDIFYNNVERREKLCRLSQSLLEKMKNNFRATNKLSTVLNENFNCKFETITLDEGKTVKENCNVFLEAVRKIQAKIEEIDRRLKEKLEPSCYQEILKLRNPSTGHLRTIQNALHGVVSLATVAGAGVLIHLIKNGGVLANISSRVARVAAGFFGCLAISALGLGIDMLLGAICGMIEKSKLDEAIREYERVLEDFGPASDNYYDTIMMVTFKLEEWV
ncbi:single-pass membrane and coiled-coil domain-containing protein 3 isoform X2 [Amia ocellicauda]|uniref:single-pass membrane and coiled-coil domain-containing protein 3 isoform X2 n=1 Tax=Amia ocellicauda TaxID=2972642 RepID=UPI0034648B6D|nr:SMCO3 protein [Amia calva]